MNSYPARESTLVLDNASIHHGARITDLFESKGMSSDMISIFHLLPFIPGCRVEYLAPYSPEHNPVEKLFSVFKNAIRRDISRLNQVNDVEASLVQLITELATPQLMQGLYRSCGY